MMKDNHEINFEVEELTRLKRLQEYERQGFVFHGSPNGNISILEPRLAADIDKSNAFNNDTAVFAALSPKAAILIACMSFVSIPPEKRNGFWSIDSTDKDNCITARIPSKWRSFVITNHGFVYVLPGETFRGRNESGWQAKSKTAVVPTAKIEVEFEDFEKSGGVIEWKEGDE
jgi:hypothetical protein